MGGDDAAHDRLCRSIIETSPYLYCVLDAEGVFRYVNPGSRAIVGWDPDQLLGKSAFEFVHEDDLEVAAKALTQVIEEFGQRPGAGVPMAIRLRHRNGDMVYVEVGTTPQFENPDVGGVIVRARPMSGQQFLDKALEALVESSPLEEVLEFLAVSLDHDMTGSSTSVAFDWLDGGFQRSVPSTSPDLLTGRSATGLHEPWKAAVRAAEVTVHETLDSLPADIAALARDRGYAAVWLVPVFGPPSDSLVACLTIWRRYEGAPWVSHHAALDRASHLTALAFDRRNNENLLRHAALHDTLTGVANRAQFFQRLESLPPPADGAVVLYLDLDSFKPVNDTHGHSAGDLVLQTVTERMMRAVRADDLVARLGGDEFAVLCPSGTGRDQAIALASRLIDVVAEPIELGDGSAVRVGVSIGIALGGSTDPGALLDAADHALYAAKDEGKGRWHLAPETAAPVSS